MSQLNELQIYALTTVSAPATGAAVSVAAITGDFTLRLHVASLTVGGTLRVAFEESSDNFVTSIVNLGSHSFAGGLGTSPQVNDVVVTFRARDLSGNLFGSAGSYVRLKITEVSGTASLEAWVTY